MQQLAQQLKSGQVRAHDVPLPQVGAGQLLVRNHFSLISSGTEGATVRAARQSLLGKAAQRPQQVRQVIEVLETQGPVQAYRAVKKRLDAYSPLGYSCAGVVIDLGSRVEGFFRGDRVACAGSGANHAEVVSVPMNLCVKLPPAANLALACYNTMGAIALQGVRQADLRLGETCAVIGLGLLGHLSCLLLKAAGIRVFGIDIDEDAVRRARRHCADQAWVRATPGIADEIMLRTGGLGADAVIITAAADSLDPVNFAGEIARKRGRVVVVGAVPTGFDREPHYYRKELELRMSCSYGPGRYDPQYEEGGLDYPPAYVRWTEKRNMEAFQHLIHSGKIDLSYLTSHTFPLDQAPDAYELVLERREPFLGVVIQYDLERPVGRERVTLRESAPVDVPGVAFVGAGSYAQSHLLPNLPAGGIARRGILTARGTTSRRVAERFGFEFCTSEPSDIFENESVQTVFVATRHDTHAEYVRRGLESGKHVFVEKPLCIYREELAELRDAYEQLAEPLQLMVGFNRRFAPLAVALKQRLRPGPMSLVYRVNAGSVPPDSWLHDPEIGGGRILGEVCHFVDLLVWLCGSVPRQVQAVALDSLDGLHDTVSVQLGFENGSLGAIHYLANGSRRLPKEYLEAHQFGTTHILSDYKELTTFGTARPQRKKLLLQDKGQQPMVEQFLGRVADGGPPLIPPEEIFVVTETCFEILRALMDGTVTSAESARDP